MGILRNFYRHKHIAKKAFAGEYWRLDFKRKTCESRRNTRAVGQNAYLFTYSFN